MRKIEYSRQAQKTLQRIDRRTAVRIVLKIEQLARAPETLVQNVKRLKGGSEFRLHIGWWRVIYTDTLVVIAIVKIAPRGGAY